MPGSLPTATSRRQGPVAAFQAAADAVALAAAWVAGLCLVALTLLVLTDTILAFLSRWIPAVPPGTGVGWEYGAYLMGTSFLLGSGLTLRAGLQLRVELLLSAGRGRMAQALETVSAALGSVVTGTLAVWLIAFCLRTWKFGEVSQDSYTPLWIPRAMLAVGATVLAIQMVARLLTCLAGGSIDRRDLGAASAIE